MTARDWRLSCEEQGETMKLLDQRLYRFAGTPKEIGLALGRRLGARLAQNIARYIETGPGRHGAIDRHKLRAGALPWLRSLPQRFQEEFEGIAAGADLPLQRLAEWAFVEKCLIEEGAEAGGCSAALVRHADHVWVARNNDLYAPDMWGYVIVREVAGRIPRLDFGLEGEIFSGTGVNRERLWLHYNWLPTRGSPRPDRPHLEGFVWLSEALETCHTLRDVESLLQRVDRDGGMMIFAVDGKGKTDEAAIYECTCSEYRKVTLDTDFIAGTNHYRLFDFDQPRGSASSLRRYRRMRELLAALMARDRAPDFPADLIAILADPAVEVRGADYGTVYAAAACPGAARMWATLGGYPAASAGRWRSLPWPWHQGKPQ